MIDPTTAPAPFADAATVPVIDSPPMQPQLAPGWVSVSEQVLNDLRKRSAETSKISSQLRASMLETQELKRQVTELQDRLKIGDDKLVSPAVYAETGSELYQRILRAFHDGHIKGSQAAKGRPVRLWRNSLRWWFEDQGIPVPPMLLRSTVTKQEDQGRLHLLQSERRSRERWDEY